MPGGILGMRLIWGKEMEVVEVAWRVLCVKEGATIQPDEGMMFQL